MFRLKLLFLLGFRKQLLNNCCGNRILLFHGIDEIGSTKYNSRFISRKYFEELIAYLSVNHTIISLDDYYLGKFNPKTLNIAITFDDGLKNNFELAMPILNKYNAPATFFVPTVLHPYKVLWPDFLDLVFFYTRKRNFTFKGKLYQKRPTGFFDNEGISFKDQCKALSKQEQDLFFELFKMDWEFIKSKQLGLYWELMSSEQLVALALNPLFEVGGHSVSHPNLTMISDYSARFEIGKSKEILEKTIGKEVNSFAFPFGGYTKTIAEYCQETGYTKLLAVQYNFSEDFSNDRLRDRLVINPHISFWEQIYFIMRGKYI